MSSCLAPKKLLPRSPARHNFRTELLLNIINNFLLRVAREEEEEKKRKNEKNEANCISDMMKNDEQKTYIYFYSLL